MRLLSEVIIDIKKGMFPQLVFDVYKSGCGIQNSEYIKDSEKDEQFRLEIVYRKRSSFLQLIGELESFPEKYRVIKIANALEEKIRGGLLRISGKFPLENMADYEIGLLGAAELVQGKIKKGTGLDFSGISKNIGMISCVMEDDERAGERKLKYYAEAERDSVLISRMTDLNPIPLVINYRQLDDLIKAVQRIEGSFSSLRFIEIDDSESLSYDQIYSDINLPVTSKRYDDIPLYLLSTISKIASKKRLKTAETAIGIVGIDFVAMRCARIFLEAGFYRVLGYDHSEKKMLTFEKNGGLATTLDNIFGNTDIVIILKNCFTDEYIEKIRPGLNIISLLDESEIDKELISKRGIREFIQVDESNLLVLFPGLAMGIIEQGNRTIGDEKMIGVARKLTGMMNDEYQLPDIFSDIHEKISGLLS
jgi:hypothetical protein